MQSSILCLLPGALPDSQPRMRGSSKSHEWHVVGMGEEPVNGDDHPAAPCEVVGAL